MIDIISNVMGNWVAIWTSGSAVEAQAAFEQNAAYTIILFAPIYLLWGAMHVFLGKVPGFINTLGFAVLGVNTALIIGPCALPPLLVVGILSFGYKMWRRSQQQPARSRTSR